MNCPEVMDHISEYIDAELPSPEEKEVKAHLLLCEDCRELVGKMEMLRNQIQQGIMSIPVPPNLGSRILNTIQEERQKVRKQLLATGFILFLLSSPLVALFYPLFQSILRVLYTISSTFFRIIQTLLVVTSPYLGLEISMAVLLITALGIYLIQILVRGLYSSEVLHDAKV